MSLLNVTMESYSVHNLTTASLKLTNAVTFLLGFTMTRTLLRYSVYFKFIFVWFLCLWGRGVYFFEEEAG